jgi:hypothetical protein
MIPVAALAMPLENKLNGEVASAVLKRCPECRDWSWMTPERQTAR